MKIFADLHVHSKYARATGKDLDLENLEKYAGIKGINLLGTGDFTHPKWIQEIKAKLAEDETGILRSKTGFPFILQTEISLVYTQGGKGRRVHHLIFAPSLDVVNQITEFLLKKGRVDYDGRPIFGMSSIELVDSLMPISEKCMIIPAHLWTPYFGAMGSESGFDSIEECFGDRSRRIYAVETGLSSDPAMNWRLSRLDKYAQVSFSDLHSHWPWRMGRECTILDIDLSYDNLLKAIKTKEGLAGTVEVDPNYGKYHFDGHRNCGFSASPSESKSLNNICPKCKRKLTIGVLNRVEELADRPEGFVPENAIPFHSLMPLSEIIAELNGWPVHSPKTWKVFNELIARFGNEFNVLLNAEREEIAKVASQELSSAIISSREGKLKVLPGFDGEYGRPVFDGRKIKSLPEAKPAVAQKGLTDFF